MFKQAEWAHSEIVVFKQAEWAHSEIVRTKAPDQGPSAMLASSTLDLLVAVSPLVHSLWEVVGAKGDSPSLSLETLNMGRSLGRRWERLGGCESMSSGASWGFPEDAASRLGQGGH